MSDDGLEPVDRAPVAEPGSVEPVAVGPGDPATDPETGPGAAPEAAPVTNPGTAAPATDPADASLLALVDRLASILERSELGELEVAAGETTIVLRSPAALERQVVASAPAPEAGVVAADTQPPAGQPTPAGATPATSAPAKPSVKAPLTGIFYGAPSPGATPYVAVGDHVSVGQIIGLIEAMKLFNEIKSDLAGRVVRVCADNGALVKARQPLIEVESA
jgi:acetyl-CoA carboxylase biotin carboxyl carrier protein